MHAEAARPVALRTERRREVGRRCRSGLEDRSERRRHALDLSIGDIETEIGARIQVELGARTDPPLRPVVVATSARDSQSTGVTNGTTSIGVYAAPRYASGSRAQHGVGGSVIADHVIATVY